MSLTKHSFILLSIVVLVTGMTPTAFGLEYSSYVWNTIDLTFFSYEDDTSLEIYESDGSVVLDENLDPVLINDGNSLDKGEHFRLTAPFYIKSNHVYLVTGSKKFSVLTGDAARDAHHPYYGGVSGYYAMDASGLGVSCEFYTYVPERVGWAGFENQQFIVFAYEDNTNVTVQKKEPSGSIYEDYATFTLQKGDYWVKKAAFDDVYLHITADKGVSALTCHDEGYFVPSANGK